MYIYICMYMNIYICIYIYGFPKWEADKLPIDAKPKKVEPLW